MPIFNSDSIQTVVMHRVGVKAAEEGLVLSAAPVPVSEQLQDLLVRYFISPFKAEECFNFYHDDHLEMNEVYRHVSNIFDDPDSILAESRHIARWLYEQGLHPNIKGGDLFVVYFSSCQLNGEETQAVGLFKSENKEPFLKVMHGDEQWSRQQGDDSATAEYRLEVHQGINVNKLDKGALVFNLETDKGYIVSTVDATNRGVDAAYWRDGFLQVCQRQDEYYQTHEVMQAYKKFITDELPQQFEGVSSADRADLLNKSVKYFKQNDNFDVDSFAEEVIQQPEVIESFKEYRRQYSEEHQTELPDEFAISEEAVKKQSRVFKSVIKLDKNFHIYVHGNRELIEQGEDEKGKFYKVYYHEES